LNKQIHKVVLLLGGNLGDRYKNLCLADELLSERMVCTQRSPIYETAAWGGRSQGFFLNRVLVIETDVQPMEVLGICQQVENRLGRSRDLKWGDRTMDIDILYYDSLIIDSPELKIPHPFIAERRFALAPLAALIPAFIHPLLNKTQQELLFATTDSAEVREWSPASDS
jgi:2-amino-4-hydroxy-6-hydroxymethyldihydropteridine diphosphokinase